MIKKSPIYLDYAATTPILPEVFKVMRPLAAKNFGNPASLHSFGQKAALILENSRATIAQLLNAKPQEIIFTGSATESNNLALKGFALANKKRGNHIIISSIEHDCIRASATWLKNQGFEITELPVDKFGLIDPQILKQKITPQTILVSIIHGNNEIGTVQDLEALAKICAQKNVCFHTDAAQSFGKIKIDVQKLNLGLLTASSHKIYGPKGAAFLYRRQDLKLEPLLHGGGQEFGLRSSTSNVMGIAGLAKAAEICYRDLKTETARLIKLRDYFITSALKKIPGCHLNGHPTKRLPNNINLRFDGLEGEALLMRLDAWGIAVSTGSACSSAKLQASPVLLALGLPHQAVHGSLRFSLGRHTTKQELDFTLKILSQEVKKLRQISPFKLK